MPETILLLSVVLPLAVVALLAIALFKLRAIAIDHRLLVGELANLRLQGREFERDLKLELSGARRDAVDDAQALRTEVGERLNQFTGTTQLQLRDVDARLGRFTERLDQFRETNETRFEALRSTLEHRFDLMRNENAEKLERMRETVDEKLKETLESRLGESFRLVSERLERVHQGLGDMQKLAAGVGDLKRVLTNVKSRGTWGEMQLGRLLADCLAPPQFGINVETVPGSDRRVEFAIRMPQSADEAPCWIPVDSKFPIDEWERLQLALDRADGEGAETSRRALVQLIKVQAKKIRDSYVCPPHTSDFAFLFLPIESLYAEMMSRPGLADELQREFRVTLAGPSNFVAFLSIVQLGFQRLAIEQRSAEVWRLLGAVRSEFGKFGDMLIRAQKKLQEASNTLDEARGKTTTIVRRLRDVESLPDAQAMRFAAAQLPIDLAPDEPRDLEEK
ncbi:MAG TPA: DNA recombination protein RmuC [Casimicrobiaceae bacterium]|nr:DNA recombination protein RmuC [Casimicrobiaceae bacterium]